MAASESELKAARRARFRQEAKAGPPPLPKRTFAHPGGKIVTSDKDAALRKLLERKLRAGEALSADQQRALNSLSTNIDLPAPAAAAVAPVEPKREPKAEAQKQMQKLRKTLHQIEELERRLASGGALEANQLAKLARKADVAAGLAALRL